MAKRKRSTSTFNAAQKRSKVEDTRTGSKSIARVHTLQPLLNKCYREVKTLKDYLLDALPTTSRVRRKRLLSFADDSQEHKELLSDTLVGLLEAPPATTLTEREQQRTHFTHTRRASQPHSATTQLCSLDEVIDFAIWSLFKHNNGEQKKPTHLLCQGFDRSVTGLREHACRPILPGILQQQENVDRNSLRTPLWRQLMSLMGADGEPIFSNLLLDCGLFARLRDGQDNYYQLSGIPVHDLCLKVAHQQGHNAGRSRQAPVSATTASQPRKLSCITMVRNRILYSKPSFNRNKSIQSGLKHMHVLNRLADLHNSEQDLTVMRYVFPRQFNMHNVFTSMTDRTETVQAFKDYTFREDELRHLSAKERRYLPRRLRGPALQLIRKMRRAHARCSYSQLLAHYCPIPANSRSEAVRTVQATNPSAARNSAVTSTIETQMKLSNEQRVLACDVPSTESEEASFMPYTTSAGHVSSFVRAALANLLPRDTFGVGHDGSENWHKVMVQADKFVCMRKFESTNLHGLVQNLKVKCVTWLAPNGIVPTNKLAVSDKMKREELLHELVYYVFDSLLIPLINSNFYVTESGIHRNKLLYFRHDVWDRLCQPCLASMKLSALVPLSARQVRGKRSDPLGYSLVRLLPKETGTRSITNLRRRTIKVVHGKRFLAQSINTKLTPVFNIFNYERRRDTGIFKSDTFSLQDVHAKLSAFRSELRVTDKQRLYLVKTDIRSAFDSIPQTKLLDLVYQIFKQKQYCTVKHAECKLAAAPADKSSSRTGVKFIKCAMPAGSALKSDALEAFNLASKRQTVYSDTDQQQPISAEQAKRLLEEHVQANIVKIGKKCYRQSVGIPQGSILSSLLCTFFYNDFEAKKLSFLEPRSSLLLRIIDDFLLITTERADAIQFVKAMKAGDASYGIVVHPEKSLVNFDMAIDGVQIPRLSDTTSFPFCGLSINSENLQVSKDRVRKDNVVANTLTVDLHGHAGEKLKRRLMSSLRIQLQGVLLDISLNGQSLVMRSLIECFQESAMKMHQYYISMPKSKQPSSTLIIQLIERLVDLVVRSMQQRRKNDEQIFGRQQICSLAAFGIMRVLSSRTTRYSAVLTWLRGLKLQTQHSLNMEPKALEQLVEDGFRALQHYIY
ncbi:Telomerase reverse transcriptase [Knufia fluminis]|uniref:Telomerase reverse transcriptase n=1 Tax=Knufia fluminis TaxID=191047 RepID=A0AAN8EF44_9EURO|nr:Telomerase reverse transcriptase [Knufia fluminis]